MPENPPNLDSLFQAAAKIQSADQRAAFLDKACGDNLELRQQVEQLLQSDQQAGSGFDETIAPSSAGFDLAEPAPAGSALDVKGMDLSASRDAESEMDFSVADGVVLNDNNHSVLRSLGNTIDEVPQVSLHKSAAQGDDPIAMPNSSEMPAHDSDSRYRLDGEIARGGMGAIFKGRDTDLGRDLAIKVLLDSHKEKPEVLQRFIEEAQISGQLQHPGIAPIYELGQFKDKRPFFAMKLVKGETLSKLLSDREDAADSRGKFIGIFEQICQTMGYAHSRRVIHRDLKPANIMVGAFGEVQVMDWGLAKVLQTGGVADEKRSKMLQQGTSIIRTLRSGDGDVGSGLPDFGSSSVGSTGSQTQMGSVMGTPAYMPPEQALGEIDNMDERADVFGLGAILCEILTGKPPYVADTGMEVYRMASRGKLDDALSRLDACGADADLIALTKECLELEPVDRPRDAGVLAERMTGYLQSVQQKLREAEVERAAEAARAEAESARATAEIKRRRTSLALAASLLLLVALGSGGWLYLERREANRQTADANAQRTHAAEMQTIAEQRDAQRKTAEQAKAMALTAQQQAERDRNAAQDAEETGRQLLYATDMQLAPLVWADDEATVPQYLDRLERHDPKINVALEGKPDIRSFEWYYDKHLIEAGAEIYAGHDGKVIDAAFNIDGKFITLDSAFRIRHWDRVTQLPTSSWDLKKKRSVRKAILSPNGQWVAVSLRDEVQVLDVDSKELRFRIDVAHGQELKMLFSEDSKVLVTSDSHTRWWDTTDGHLLGEKDNLRHNHTDKLSVSRDGLIAVRFRQAHANADLYRLILNDDGQPTEVKARLGNLPASAVEFFPDGRNFVIGIRKSGGLSVYNADSYQKIVAKKSYSAPIYSIGFSSDGKTMAAAAKDGVIKLWRVTKQNDELELKQIGLLKGHRDEIFRIFFSSDNQSIVSCGSDGTARIWNLDREASTHFLLEASRSKKYSYSSNGLLVAGAATGKIDFWDAATGRKIQTLFDKDTKSDDVVAFSPDHRLIAVGGERTVTLWEIDSGRKVRELHEDFPRRRAVWRTKALAFSPDGKLLVTAFGQTNLIVDNGRPLKVWDVASGRFVADLVGHHGECLAVQFSADGARLATGSHDGTARIWDTSNWQSIRELRNPDLSLQGPWGGLVTHIAFSKDGHQLAFNSLSNETERKSFFLWDAASGNELIPMDGHANTVQDLCFSPNGRTLATVSRDETLRLWNVATRQQLMKLDSKASVVSFSPDGDQLLASSTVIPTRPSLWQDPERAAVKLEELLQSNVDFASRIRLFSENLRLHEAVAVLQKRHPNDLLVQAALAATRANWHASKERWDLAAIEFDELQKLAPQSSYVWFRTAGLLRVARALFEQDQMAPASELIHAASKQWRTDGLRETKTFSKTLFETQIKAMQSEVQQRLKADSSDTDEGGLTLLLAEVEGLLGDAPTQIEAYNEALKLLSDRPLNQVVGQLEKLYIRRGDAYMTQLQWKRALDDYNQVVTDKTEDESLLASQALAMANVLLDDSKAAAMKIGDPWTRLSVAQALRGKNQLAIKSFDRALQAAIGVEAKQAIFDQAIRFDGFTEQLAADHPRDAQIQYALARVLFQRSRKSFRQKSLADALPDMERSRTQLEVTMNIDPDNSHAARMLAELIVEIENQEWTTLTTTAGGVKSKGGAKLNVLGDGSILASGKNPDQDIYTITTNAPFKRIRAFRLEAIPDASLPRDSISRCRDGRFGVNKFRVLVNGQPRRLDAVTVSYTGFRDYLQLISGETDVDAWEIDNRMQERHSAVMLTDLELTDDDTLAIEIVCASSRARGRNLGRFRLSVSDDPDAYMNADKQFAAMKVDDPLTRLEVIGLLTDQKGSAIESFSRAIKRNRNVDKIENLIQLASNFDGVLSKLGNQHSDNREFQYALSQFYIKSDHVAVRSKARPILEAILKADPNDVSTANLLANLLVGIQRDEEELHWKIVKPSDQNLKSEGGATLTLLDDGSILASGKNPDQDGYQLTTTPPLQCIKAIRLEVIPDPSLPKNGPGRYLSNGNFNLSKFNVLINETQQTLDEISASNLPNPKNDKLQAVINGSNSKEYWGVNRRAGQRNTAFVATDLELAAGDKLTIELLTSRGKHSQHNLGRFRLSVTDDPDAYANGLKRFAYQNAQDPWAKLAIAYELIGDEAARDELLKQHPQAAENLPQTYLRTTILTPRRTITSKQSPSVLSTMSEQSRIGRGWSR